MGGQTVGVVLRLRRETTTNMVGGDDSLLPTEGGNQAAVVEGPGWVAMDEQHWRATPLIHIAHHRTRYGQLSRLEGVEPRGESRGVEW